MRAKKIYILTVNDPLGANFYFEIFSSRYIEDLRKMERELAAIETPSSLSTTPPLLPQNEDASPLKTANTTLDAASTFTPRPFEFDDLKTQLTKANRKVD